MVDLVQIPKLGEWAPNKYVSSAPAELASPDIMVAGSLNFMLTGTGKLQVFKGITLVVGKKGSIVMMNVAENFAGIGRNVAPTPPGPDGTAYGNAYNVYSALFYI